MSKMKEKNDTELYASTKSTLNQLFAKSCEDIEQQLN
jgi:hypothetical protein